MMTEYFVFFFFCFSVGNMLQTRRVGDNDLRESSQKNRRIDIGRGETLDLIIAGLLTIHFSVHVSLQLFYCTNSRVPSCFFKLGNPYREVNSEELIGNFSDWRQSVWSELNKEVTSKFSRSVVSLALSDADIVVLL
jgi:hypothetical protein